MDGHLPARPHHLLDPANLTHLTAHVQCLRPKHWTLTGNRLKPWKQLLGLAFHATAQLLTTETDRDSWHFAAVYGHSLYCTAKFCPLLQLMGHLSPEEDSHSLSTPEGWWSHRTIDHSREWRPTGWATPLPASSTQAQTSCTSPPRFTLADKLITRHFVHLAYSLFQMDKNLSQVNKLMQRDLLHKSFHALPSCGICQWDGIPRPQPATFFYANKLLPLPLSFHPRPEKSFPGPQLDCGDTELAFKSSRAPTAQCLCCDETETMEHLLDDCLHNAA
jgi:hypothetical protein